MVRATSRWRGQDTTGPPRRRADPRQRFDYDARSHRQVQPAGYATRLGMDLAGCAGGNPTSLGRLYDETIGWVYPLACRVTGDRAAAGALTRLIYQRIWQQATGYDRRCQCPVAWLIGQVGGQLTRPGRAVTSAPRSGRPAPGNHARAPRRGLAFTAARRVSRTTRSSTSCDRKEHP